MEHALGTWNVQALNKPYAQIALLKELQRYKLQVTEIQVTMH